MDFAVQPLECRLCKSGHQLSPMHGACNDLSGLTHRQVCVVSHSMPALPVVVQAVDIVVLESFMGSGIFLRL